MPLFIEAFGALGAFGWGVFIKCLCFFINFDISMEIRKSITVKTKSDKSMRGGGKLSKFCHQCIQRSFSIVYARMASMSHAKYPSLNPRRQFCGPMAFIAQAFEIRAMNVNIDMAAIPKIKSAENILSKNP